MYRRAQAAMEFLMTYGWAILVVLAAIAALAYFGVLSPDRFLPEKCTLPSGTACLDFTYDAVNGITMSIQNSAGFDMTAVTVSLAGTGCNIAAAPAATTLTDGEKKQFQATVAAGCAPPAGKFKGVITMAYTNSQTGMDHTKTGEIILKI